ncbi:MAG: ankyrin repeat domain-containing protein, partial [Victivallaceae bacterium]
MSKRKTYILLSSLIFLFFVAAFIALTIYERKLDQELKPRLKIFDEFKLRMKKYIANINQKNEHGDTLLHNNCNCNGFEFVKYLIVRGADVNAK